MPDPNKKLSTPSTESPCDIKLACFGGPQGTEQKKTCQKMIKIEEADIQHKAGDERKSAAAVIEKQARLNKEPCSLDVACHLARPNQEIDPTSRIDKTKPACINFEACDDDDDGPVETQEERKLETGCIDYEDLQAFLAEEKRLLKQKKQEEKQKMKEKAPYSFAGGKCFKNN